MIIGKGDTENDWVRFEAIIMMGVRQDAIGPCLQHSPNYGGSLKIQGSLVMANDSLVMANDSLVMWPMDGKSTSHPCLASY